MITDIFDPNIRNQRCLLLFSGGFDSTFVAILLKRVASSDVLPLCIDYANRPSAEQQRADKIIARLSLEKKIETTLPLHDFRLTREKWLSPRHEGWIPYRNILFFGIAAHFAYLNSCNIIAAGTRVWDTTAYDDATVSYLNNLETLLQSSGSGQPQRDRLQLFLPIIESHDPIKKILASDFEARSILQDTWSCWRDGSKPCGECAPCVTREKFFLEL